MDFRVLVAQLVPGLIIALSAVAATVGKKALDVFADLFRSMSRSESSAGCQREP
jgi:hypothetical protein